MNAASLFWFRRDLRLADNPALLAAAKAGPVLGVFVVDPALWDPSGPNRRRFLVDSLASLNQSMNGSLVVVEGDPVEVLPRLCRSVDAAQVYAAEDFGPYGRQRDGSVAAALEEAEGELVLIDTPYAIAPGSVVTGGGTSYKVFTPFSRAWAAHGWSDPHQLAQPDWLPEPVPSSAEELIERLTEAATAEGVTPALPTAGEDAAWEAADRFLEQRVGDYQNARDLPGVDGTSRLGAYLKWGTLHPRQLLDRLGDSPGEQTFRSELCWREFYAEVLFSRPDSARQAYVPKMAAMAVDEGPEADERFRAWCEARTGYPIVDAGMRQLLAQGWMHNRVRMIVASFLVKDLHLDWTRGARFFMEHLVDGDLASNSHGWQWVAGTGTDASPYFRIFNPVTQSKKFDAGGDYLRQWIPEIAHLPERSIHSPWTEKTGAPAAYPGPIVDHDTERQESLARYEQAKLDWA
ncbi:MAG: cryptochrome/photolyase family protein [Acidimicrobiales bacterium]